MGEIGGEGRDEWAVTAEVQTSEQRIPHTKRDVCVAPQESSVPPLHPGQV